MNSNYDKNNIFAKILRSEIECKKINENDYELAFLDINPNARGHTLCVPKQETNKIFDMQPQQYLELMRFSRRVALAIEKTVPCKRVGVSVIGLEVPHVHVHLIPLNTMEDARFINKVTLEKETFEALAKAISDNL